MLVSRGAYIRGAYIREFTVYEMMTSYLGKFQLLSICSLDFVCKYVVLRNTLTLPVGIGLREESYLHMKLC